MVRGLAYRTGAALALVSLATGCSSNDPAASGPASCDAGVPFYCVPASCGGDVVWPAVCDHGTWSCPDDKVPMSSCPSDACFHPPVTWCCDAAGNASRPTCPGQGNEVCPSGTYITSGPTGCPAAGTFPCGSALSCKLGQEYCLHQADAWSCEPLPAGCGSSPDCSCLSAGSCGQCQSSGIGALTLFC